MSEQRDTNDTAAAQRDAGRVAQPPQAPLPGAPGDAAPTPAHEVGGRAGPDPTRYGDWEKNGRCIDF